MRSFFSIFSRQNTVAISAKSTKRISPRVFFNVVLLITFLIQNTLFGLPSRTVYGQRLNRAGKTELLPTAAFTAGNLAVLQAAASANNTTASIVELNPNPSPPATNPVQTIPILGTGASALRFSGSATSTGYLSNTNDGSLLSFNGANSTNTASNVNTLNPRGVGTLDAVGNFVLQTTYTGSSGDQTRSSTSLNNTNWFIADQGGIFTNGASSPSPSGNFRAIKSFGGTVYVGQASSTATVIQVATVSAPSGGTITGLPGLSNNASHQDFYLISSGSNGAIFDVLYTISATSNTAGSIAKFSLNTTTGNWVANGTYTTTFGGFGLAAADTDSGAVLYVSTGQGALTANSVIRLTDTAGYNTAISITTASNLTLYTAPAGNIIKGVAFAPRAVAVSSPEINVTGNGATIPDGDTTPSTTDFTDFGNVAAGGSFDRTFTIQNIGTADLTGGAISISGTNAGDFTVLTPPTFPVTQGNSTSFTIRFTPSATGSRTATINIASNDTDENPYDFAVLGTRLASATPTILESTLNPLINLPASGAGFLSGVINDATDPAQVFGVDFTIADSDTPTGSLIVTATSSNQTVVPDANLVLSGAGSNARNLKITPVGVGYSTLTISVGDGNSAASFVINYAASAPSNANSSTRWHTGKADASTAVALDADYMFVADDEDQTIRLYDRNASGLPLNSFNFTANLALTDISGGVPREVDIEASAQSGNRIFWLASHSNSSSGNNRPNRSRLFATDISGSGAAATLSYVGRYDNLKTDLINWDANNLHGLGASFFGLAASAQPGVIPEAPDGSGFNIEGLVFAPDDSTAYISFRAPIVPANNRTKALIVPVTNFASLVAGNPGAGPAVFGAPIQLNLAGRGIGEIKKNAANEYLIIAGDAGANGNFATYSWTGNPSDAPVLRGSILTGLNPESIVDLPVGLNGFSSLAAVQVQLLSDNGDDVYYNDGVIAKELANNEFKKFRSDLVTIQAVAPTAANVSVSGRVSSFEGEALRNALVIATNTTTGESKPARTNSFGYFSISDLRAGTTFIFDVRAKGYSFEPRVLSVIDNISDLNLISAP